VYPRMGQTCGSWVSTWVGLAWSRPLLGCHVCLGKARVGSLTLQSFRYLGIGIKILKKVAIYILQMRGTRLHEREHSATHDSVLAALFPGPLICTASATSTSFGGVAINTMPTNLAKQCGSLKLAVSLLLQSQASSGVECASACLRFQYCVGLKGPSGRQL
jgi:hypothetical protein